MTDKPLKDRPVNAELPPFNDSRTLAGEGDDAVRVPCNWVVYATGTKRAIVGTDFDHDNGTFVPLVERVDGSVCRATEFGEVVEVVERLGWSWGDDEP